VGLWGLNMRGKGRLIRRDMECDMGAQTGLSLSLGGGPRLVAKPESRHTLKLTQAARDIAVRLRHLSGSAKQLTISVEELRRFTRPLEVAEVHIGASMGKLEQLAALVENVRILRDLSLPLRHADRVDYYDTATAVAPKAHILKKKKSLDSDFI
jgi:hypothetical protein